MPNRTKSIRRSCRPARYDRNGWTDTWTEYVEEHDEADDEDEANDEEDDCTQKLVRFYKNYRLKNGIDTVGLTLGRAKALNGVTKDDAEDSTLLNASD